VALLLSASLARAQTPTYDDVVVGQVPLDAGGTMPLFTDIHLPAANAPTPMVVYIHGGSWLTGDHNGVPAPIHALLGMGVAVATVGYRHSDQAIFPAQIHDVKGVVRYLRANASTYNIDPERIGCWGVSSGGHLALLMATSGGSAELEGTVGGNVGVSSRIAAVVDYFGPTDILNMNPDVTQPPGTGRRCLARESEQRAGALPAEVGPDHEREPDHVPHG
jgi:acetyl esterase/lipase